jgi:hypothetical protein
MGDRVANPEHQVRVCGWKCKNGHQFDAPFLGDFAYGEFIAFGPGGAAAFVDSFKDPVWDEVTALVDEIRPSNPPISDRVDADVLQFAFGMTLDPDPTGSFRIDVVPCPVCGANSHHFAEIEPARWEEVSPATHDAWMRLSIDEKRRVVAEAARSVLGS